MPIGAPGNIDFRAPQIELSDYGRQLEAENDPEVQAQRSNTHARMSHVMEGV